MPNPETLRALTTPEDGALFSAGLATSKFAPRNPVVFTPEVRQKFVMDAASTVNAGSNITFAIEKNATMIEDCALYFTPPALAVAGGATYNRYCNWLAYAALDKLEIRYGSNNIQTYRPDQLFVEDQIGSDECKANSAQLALGNLTAAQRNTYALNPTPVRLNVPTPWIEMRDHAPPICALANKIQFTFYFKTPSYFIQTDGVKAASIAFTDVHFDYQGIHETGRTRGEYTAVTQTPQGVSYLYDDVQSADYAIPAGLLTSAQGANIELRDIDGSVSKSYILLRTEDQLDPSNPDIEPYGINPLYYSNCSYNINSNGMYLYDQDQFAADGVYKYSKFLPGRANPQAIILLWTEFPETKNCAAGSMSFGNFTNPKLNLKNSLAVGHPNLVATFIAYRYNWYVVQRGNLQRVWR